MLDSHVHATITYGLSGTLQKKALCALNGTLVELRVILANRKDLKRAKRAWRSEVILNQAHSERVGATSISKSETHAEPALRPKACTVFFMKSSSQITKNPPSLFIHEVAIL